MGISLCQELDVATALAGVPEGDKEAQQKVCVGGVGVKGGGVWRAAAALVPRAWG